MSARHGLSMYLDREGCILSRIDSYGWKLSSVPETDGKVWLLLPVLKHVALIQIAYLHKTTRNISCNAVENAAPYQQCYRNGKRAHRRIQRSFVQFCYLCAELIHEEVDWFRHCQYHLENLQPRFGILTFRYTLVAAGLCPFCLGDESRNPDERFKQWMTKSTLLNHIEEHMRLCRSKKKIQCPHPLCQKKEYDGITGLRRHFFDVHSITEPRSNCVARKRRWPLDEEPCHVVESEMEDFGRKKHCESTC